MEKDVKMVVGAGDLQPYTIPSSDLTGGLLVKLDHLSLLMFENKEGIEFSTAGHPEEGLILVLDGQLELKHGPVIEAGEAIFIVPNTPYAGEYTGKLLMVQCIPRIASAINPDVMKKVIKPEEVEVIHTPTGAMLRPLAVTDNLGICRNERGLGGEFAAHGHPEEEIIYILQGQVDYVDGRVVKANEASFNLSDAPHGGSYSETIWTQVLEAKSPSDPSLARFKL